MGGFHIGKTINFKSNVNSDYLLLLNCVYIENLSDEKLSLLKSKTVVDDQLLEMVEKTYKTVLYQKEKTKIMYDPPMLNRIVDNGNLVFEFSYGKNTDDVSFDGYVRNSSLQKDFITGILKSLESDVYNKLGLKCNFFINKRVN